MGKVQKAIFYFQRKFTFVLSFLLLLGFTAAPAQARADFTVNEAEWKQEKSILTIRGRAPAGTVIQISDPVSKDNIGTATANRKGRWRLRLRNPQSVPCSITATMGGQRIEKPVEDAPDNCNQDSNPPAPPTEPEEELTGLYLTGPESLTEGQTVRYTLTAVYTSGTTVYTSEAPQDIFDNLEWDVTPPGFAIIEADGSLSALEVDADQRVTISATHPASGGPLTASANVTVLNTGENVSGSHAGRFSAYEGTKTCLECHTDEAMEVHASAHYQWKGDASEAVGLSADVAGKLGGINDFCIYPDINWIGKLNNVDGVEVGGGCAKCHVGLGAKPSDEVNQSQLENIDCLVCHSDPYKRTVAMVDGDYQFVPDTEKMDVSILQAASDIAPPSNDSCLNCHTKAGGGNNFKRGDIEEAHRNATRDFDVHLASRAMGGAGLSCLDCHTAASHRIAGRGVDLRPRDSIEEVSCTNCHSASPHHDEKLDKHTARVNCTVCHIPTFAKKAPTDMVRDWRQPGDLVAATGLYEPHHEKGQNVTPVYRFFNGTSTFYEFGSEAVAGADGRIVMAAPIGRVNDSNAKIHAFKHHLGYQPIDSVTRRLLPLKIGKFFENGQIDTAIALGSDAVGWDYTGHDFAQTERYLGLFHEVAPKEQALSCNSCHDGDRMDFGALGYTPNETRNGRDLCTSCHGNESDEWRGSEYFSKVHEKHVKDKKYDCRECHNFSSAN